MEEMVVAIAPVPAVRTHRQARQHDDDTHEHTRHKHGEADTEAVTDTTRNTESETGWRSRALVAVLVSPLL